MSFVDPRHTRSGSSAPISSGSLGSRSADPGAIDLGSRLAATGRARAAAGYEDERPPSGARRRGSPYRRVTDWERVGLVSAGLVVGAVVGAAAALLFAPQSGVETRTALRRGARAAGRRAADGWDDLAYELRAAADRARRRTRRAMRRARFKAGAALGRG